MLDCLGRVHPQTRGFYALTDPSERFSATWINWGRIHGRLVVCLLLLEFDDPVLALCRLRRSIPAPVG